MCSEREDEATRNAEAAPRQAKTASQAFDAMFPSIFNLKEAERLADKIHRAAKLCREADEDDDPFSTQAKP